ncbi:MAG: tetratricopeptide repeat protein [Chloroflexi bacterium]|nr:tetratricopeptide repeat protein [Chloroflexota bacterium]
MRLSKSTLTLAYNNRGCAYKDKGEYDRAIADYDKAISLTPDFPEAYNNKGLAYYGNGDYIHAIENYAKAIGINPNHAYPYLNRGITYAILGDQDRTIADLDDAVRLCPNYEADFIDKKFVAIDGSIELAMELLKSVVNSPRKSEFDYYYTGVRSLFLNDLLSAEMCFMKASKLGSEFAAKIDRHLENLKNRK